MNRIKFCQEKLPKFRGKFQEVADYHHGRIYPFEVLQENIDRLVETIAKHNVCD
jgi:hypothetical protein